MQKICLLYIVAIILGSCKQQASKEYLVRPCEFVCDYPFSEVNKWAVTCRVWGLLKYYHPNITSGTVDWDRALSNTLDDVRYITTPEVLNAELKDLLSVAGSYKYEKDKDWDDSLNMNRDLGWIDNSFLDESLRNELKKIASMKVENPFYSIERDSTGLVYSNEKEQKIINNSNMLTLFRYWNVVYYYFPYKYKMTQSWDETLTQFIPIFLEATNKSSLDIALLKLVALIDDGHGTTSVEGGWFDAEASDMLEKVGDSTVSRVSHGGVEKGDIILRIGDQDIRDIRDSLSVLTAASNQLGKDFNINTRIAYMMYFRETDIVISRGGKQQNLHLVPSEFESGTRAAYSKINDHIGYVNLDVLKSDQVQSMFESLSHTKGIIFDLRNYPMGVGWDDIVGYCIEEKEVPYLRFTYPDVGHPGAFYWSENVRYLPVSSGVPKYEGKIVVLVNEYTQSRAEVYAVMFRTTVQATLIGRLTSGSNGEISRILLPKGQFILFSALGAYYPDKSEIQRIGIIPDIEVYADMESILAGKDEILDAAIEYLEKQKSCSLFSLL